MRRRKLFAGVTALALLAVGAPVFWPWPDRFTAANCAKICKGMSRAQVEAILGPPGDYSTGPTETYIEHWQYTNVVANDGRRLWEEGGTEWSESEWRGDTLDMLVEFVGPEVRSVRTHSSARIEQGRLDNLLWRAKRQWRKWFPDR